MPTFKVVLDGINLSEEQSQRIARSVQQSVLQELAGLDNHVDDSGKPTPLAFALLPIAVGQTMGLVGTEPPDPQRVDEIIASEFGPQR